jgi:GGDEF domain-containing protein
MVGSGAEQYSARMKQVMATASAIILFLCTVVFGIASVSDDFKNWLVRPGPSPLAVGLTVVAVVIGLTAVFLLLMDQLRRQYRALEGEMKEQRERSKAASDEIDAYQERLTRLRKVVGGLEQLAYYDPITGIPNSNFLELQIDRADGSEGLRCLILLDLRNFGEVNKRFNHWKGDQYLSKFGQMVEEEGRRNEYIMKRRPLVPENVANKSFEEEDVMAFRKTAGGDEFYILLKGTIIDGLGYLNRLQGRASDFETMSIEILGEKHAFAFHAGLIAVAPKENFLSATKRVMAFLGLAVQCPSSTLYWAKHELPILKPGSVAEKTFMTAISTFGNPHEPTATTGN